MWQGAKKALGCFLLVLGLLVVGHPNACAFENEEIDFQKLENELRTTGLVGWIHATVADQSIAVFTWRSPENFFVNVQFPLVAHDDFSATYIPMLRRHDKVRVKGSFRANSASPQRHIIVHSVELIERIEAQNVGTYQYQTDLIQTLGAAATLIVKVHAVEQNGKVLVVEVGDRVVPIFVPEADDAAGIAGFYRGDKIRIEVVTRRFPNRPLHLSLNRSKPKRVERLESLVELHGKPAQVKGVLVKFVKSPQIIRDVYAIQTTDLDGVVHEYTVLSENTELFNAITQKLAAAFKENEAQAVNGRNKLIIPDFYVTATGKFNVVAPGQANPQIFVDSLDDVVVGGHEAK